MEFLYFLEKLRVPVLNELMLLVTHLGEETAFLVLALVVFWCVDKYRGYFVLGVGLMGTVLSQFMKLLFRIPRPWVPDENFTILEEARTEAGGYSFPSGHTQTAVGTFGSIAASTKRKTVGILCIILAVLVGFSRMYVGVHTPADVLVGALLSVALIAVLYPFMLGKCKKGLPVVFLAMLAVSIGFLLYVELLPDPEALDPHNYESAMKNAYTLLGCCTGVLVVYFVDEKKLDFQTEAVWWAQILKVVLGLGAVLAVKEGLRAPLDALFAGHLAARAVRYFLIVVVSGIVWPLSFRWFGKLGRKDAK
jgi:undecaprenyl-diphosphatase